MREILFRGKRIDNGEWVEGAYMPYYYSTRYGKVAAIFTNDDVLCKTSRYPVDPSTVGQYVGLKDKNGKRIFEGDILGTRYYYLSPDNVAVEVVKWFCNGWVIQEGDRPPTMLEEDEIMPYSEVIGNVHDNKELWGGNESRHAKKQQGGTLRRMSLNRVRFAGVKQRLCRISFFRV